MQPNISTNVAIKPGCVVVFRPARVHQKCNSVLAGTTSSQFYKTFTCLYLKVCNTGLFLKSLVAKSVVEFNLLMLILTLKFKNILNLTSLVAESD